jgi:methylglyoxal synthase
MKVKIYYVEVAPELESKEFDLALVIKSKGECIVGRSPECDLPLEGSDLSRQHGKFWIKNDCYYFADLGSSNGSLFNGELAEPNQEHLLKIGDTIRLGDFVLKMEPAEEIAATVMKVLDPALFKPRPPQIVDASQPEPQISPVVPAIGLAAAAAISMPIIVDRSEEKPSDLSIEQPLSPVLIEDEWSNDNTPDLVVTELPAVGLVKDEWIDDNTSDYLQDSTVEQAVAEQPAVALVIEDKDGEEELSDSVIAAQSPPALVLDEDGEIEQPEVIPARPLSALLLDDEDDEVEELAEPVIGSQPPSTLVLEDEDEQGEFEDPVIVAQPPSALILDEDGEELSDFIIAAQSPSALVLDDELPDPVIATQVPSPLVLDDEDGEDELPDSVIATQVPSALVLEGEEEITGDLLDSSAFSETAPTLVADDDEQPELITAIVTEQPAEILVVEEDDPSVAVPDTVMAVAPVTTLEIEDGDSEQLPDLFATEPQSAVFLDEGAEEDEDLPSLLVTQLPGDVVVEEIEETAAEQDLPNLVETEQLSDRVVVEELKEAESLEQDDNLQVESTSSLPIVAAAAAVAAGISTHHKKIGAELLSQKQIVLIAHDEKVADLTDLVNQHKDFLSTCLTISWASIAGTLRQETGMSVSKELPSGVSGGFQTLAGLVNSDDVLAVIFLKDFFAQAQAGQANEEALLRLCNINEILLATNIATAESIVHYLQS